MSPGLSSTCFPVQNYDLAATLAGGQAFRWRFRSEAWEGFVGARWARLRSVPEGILAETAPGPVDAPEDWSWLRHYLQIDLDLDAVLRTFPSDDPSLQKSIEACRGLRLLRQEPWECLASFICSSTKQIVQIQQIVELLCERHGDGVNCGPAATSGFAFPTAERLAGLDESALRACKMGFRAPYVLAAARAVADGRLDLEGLRRRSCSEAREALIQLPGVGLKIADCVLLFAYGFQEAFPVDVWVMKALRQLYFPKRRPTPARLQRFIGSHFGPHAGYAQQYLFHYMRTRRSEPSP